MFRLKGDLRILQRNTKKISLHAPENRIHLTEWRSVVGSEKAFAIRNTTTKLLVHHDPTAQKDETQQTEDVWPPAFTSGSAIRIIHPGSEGKIPTDIDSPWRKHTEFVVQGVYVTIETSQKRKGTANVE